MAPVIRAHILFSLLLALAPLPALAQGGPDKISLPQEHRGKQVTISGDLYLPQGTARVPAMVVHHGSGGVAERERTYAREIAKLGVAALVLDSFKGRGVADTVRDQSAVTNNEMLDDAFAALQALGESTLALTASALASSAFPRAAPLRCSLLMTGAPEPCRRSCASRCTYPSTQVAARSITNRSRRARRSICCLAAPILTWALHRARSMQRFSRPRERAWR